MLEREPVQVLQGSIVVGARELELCQPEKRILNPWG
jgi:hypothetical protein